MGEKNPQSEEVMKRTNNYAKYLTVAVVLTQLPTFLRADCVPSGATGDVVPFTLVSLKNNQVASYATGALTISNSDIPASIDQSRTLSATQIPQLFSDRTANYDPGCTGKICLGGQSQPFNVFQADQLGVNVTESTTLTLGTGFKTSINVTLTLESWRNAKQSFTGTCAPTGELYGTFDSNTFEVIVFGTPEPPQPPPPIQ
jgi:hypothetical protein